MPVEGPHLLGCDGFFRDPISVAAGAEHTCLRARERGGQLLGRERQPSTRARYAADQQRGSHDRGRRLLVRARARPRALLLGRQSLRPAGDRRRHDPLDARAGSGVAHAGALAAGGAHTCATADDASGARALFCWGANGSSQLGNGSSTDAPVATRISSLSPRASPPARPTPVRSPPATQLYCWGSGGSRQLGFDPGGDGVATIPTINDLSPPTAATASSRWPPAHGTPASARRSPLLYCASASTPRSIGNPPLLPPAPAKVKALTAGDAHSCALDPTGKVWCWGRGDQGQLGDGRGWATPCHAR